MTVVDVRAGHSVVGGLVQQAHNAGVEVLRGFVPIEAKGSVAVSGIEVRQVVGGRANGEARSLVCDAIGMAGGWNPAIHLYSHSGGKAQWSEAAACFVPGGAQPDQFNVGACPATWPLGKYQGRFHWPTSSNRQPAATWHSCGLVLRAGSNNSPRSRPAKVPKLIGK